ncbi:phosphorylcholine transferase LicD [Prevotella sp. OH937_COT-195]|uniref:LicD family protein n=1 Tax=Prevotella sp. OH937_COT-195 TaxID=2491051 RepID=UPI000F64EB40|nr:LicD family protein [Prevotella sp. OH937_COT-195]RRD02583.1 LicD family protein [Prevotella sp. OH937_COT-195]
MVKRTNKDNVEYMQQISLKIEEIQEVSLRILKRITSVCEEHGFRYTLAFGTLIGAIRHKGFIPWDDDVDILMPRPDYERFILYLTNHPIEDLKVFNWKCVKNYPLGITRICDMRYRVLENNFIDFDHGIFVDVYPVDGLANSYNDAKKAFDRTAKERDELFMSAIKKYREIRLVEFFKNPRLTLSKLRRRILGICYYQRKLEEKVIKYTFEDYKYVGVPNWNWARIVFERDWFNDRVKVPFENDEFYITKHYDKMLREEYGDYMQLPPIEKRVYHHGYIAYRR